MLKQEKVEIVLLVHVGCQRMLDGLKGNQRRIIRRYIVRHLPVFHQLNNTNNKGDREKSKGKYTLQCKEQRGRH